VAADFVKDCFAAGSASAAMAEFLTGVISAFQKTSAYTCADMLGLNVSFKHPLARRMK
jgi:hypothetical protein